MGKSGTSARGSVELHQRFTLSLRAMQLPGTLAGQPLTMRTWTSGLHHSTGEVAGYNVELSFALEEGEETAERADRASRVEASLRAIAHTDDRLVSWRVMPAVDRKWMHVHAVVAASAPGIVAELSEQWMRRAIESAEPRHHRIPHSVYLHQESRWNQYARTTVRAQVLADS